MFDCLIFLLECALGIYFKLIYRKLLFIFKTSFKTNQNVMLVDHGVWISWNIPSIVNLREELMGFEWEEVTLVQNGTEL